MFLAEEGTGSLDPESWLENSDTLNKEVKSEFTNVIYTIKFLTPNPSTWHWLTKTVKATTEEWRVETAGILLWITHADTVVAWYSLMWQMFWASLQFLWERIVLQNCAITSIFRRQLTEMPLFLSHKRFSDYWVLWVPPPHPHVGPIIIGYDFLLHIKFFKNIPSHP